MTASHHPTSAPVCKVEPLVKRNGGWRDPASVAHAVQPAREWRGMGEQRQVNGLLWANQAPLSVSLSVGRVG